MATRSKKKKQNTLCELPIINQRDPAFVRQVIAGLQGPWIDNVVTNCKLRIDHNVDEDKAPLNIQDAAWRLAGKHDPKQFKASTSVRLYEDPSGTYLMFPSECMVMTGVRCPELVLSAALRITRYYSQVYQRLCHLEAYQVNNVHGVINIGYPLDLDGLHKVLPQSLLQPTSIKCLIFKIEVPFRKPPDEGPAPLQHMLRPIEIPDLPPRRPRPLPTSAAEETDEPPRKRRKKKKSGNFEITAVYEDDVKAREELGDAGFIEQKKKYNGPVFTTSQIEVFTSRPTAPTATVITPTRKKPKNPNHAAINVWQSGKVGILGRTEEHLFDAAVKLVRLLAQFTMSH